MGPGRFEFAGVLVLCLLTAAPAAEKTSDNNASQHFGVKAAGLPSAGRDRNKQNKTNDPASLQRYQETELEIPTYIVGPDDKNPPLWNLRVYPYPRQTDITRTRRIISHRVVILENDYIRVLILPDLGGRVYAAHDKTNDDFDFIYHNHVIKPGLVALRGAWLSGGIEWNFPTFGHAVNTFSPVQYRIVRHDDGSVTCVVGTEEWVQRMKWSVFITLHPDRSYFKTRILLFNRTLTHNNGYFWANAAAHAWDDTRIIFPPTNYTFPGRRANPQPWPIYNGKDRSWYRNTPYARDYFGGVPGDFHGSYNFERDCGTAHCAGRHEAPGKKFWTWGTARSGAIWEDLLTDDDGQYLELQSGRLLTQGDTWVFEPHLAESWDEYWYPLKKMQGLLKANPDAAVNLRIAGDSALVALNTTRVLEGARLEVFCGEKQIYSERVNIDPKGCLARKIPLNARGEDYRLMLLDRQGREVIAYSTATETLPAPELQPEMPDTGDACVEQTYLAGYYALKRWNTEQAVRLFKEALEKDPGCTRALRSLGIVYYQTGRFKKAHKLFHRALQRNEDDHTARYYRALCKIRLGIRERTEEDLYMVGRRAAFRHVAPYVLASLAVESGDLPKAEALLRRAIRHNPDDLKARVALAAILRNRGLPGEAAELVNEVLKDDPLNCPGIMEKLLLGGGDELDVLRDDPQYYLETACDYAEMNLISDAVAVLQVYERRSGAAAHPLVYYFLAYYCDRMSRSQEARSYFLKGSQLSPDYVFPFRTESEAVLQTALRCFPEDWKLHYYLGNLLTARLRWEEGLKHFQEAERSAPEYAVLYRNLGEIYWKKLNDREKAAAAYERAISCNPNDYNLYVALDCLYAELKHHAKRARLFAKAPPEVMGNFNVLLRQAAYCVDTERYEQALQILRRHTFHPWEGWTGARQVYVLALHGRADRSMQEGDYKRAIEDLTAAMEYPENLGTGKPHQPDHAKEHYKLGCCYQALGSDKLAREHFKKAGTGPAQRPP